MGCPVPNVASRGKGSGLILRPDVSAELIQAAKAGGLPVSVKTRLGYNDVNEWEEWLTHILKQDIANLSIHLRTRKEMSQVDAHWELIPEIKKLRDRIAPNTLLTINGDIPDRQTGLQLAEQYGIDGVMIGRGIFKNPFAFEKEPKEHSSKEYLDLLRLQLDLQDQYAEELPRSITGLHHGIKHAKYVTGKAEILLPKWVKEGWKPDVIIVDPPRTGLDEQLLKTILKVKPKKVVYVS